jgi:transposase
MAKYRKYSLQDMEEAKLSIGAGKSIRQAAKDCGVPEATLRRYIAEDDHNQADTAFKISQNDEERVVKWILTQEKLGYAPTLSMVKAVVTSLAKKTGDTRPLGHHWMERFLKRRPEIRTKLGKRID